MEMTSVRYAWYGTILLLLFIAYVEGKEWLRARKEKRLVDLQKRRIVALAALFLAVPALAAEGGPAMGWLHPDIIDRLERFIMTVGFSVFTALWFMFRAEKRLDENNKLQTEQIALLKQLLGLSEDK
jgi:hypothetical protein